MSAQPPSRLLTRLDEEIAKAGDSVEGDCLRAERAVYVLRDGHHVQAREFLALLQDRYARHPNIRISSWLSLLDGLTQYFDALGPNARDKILRAQALAASANLSYVDALASAWLAQLDFMLQKPTLVKQNVQRALALSDGTHRAARSRVAMVMATGFHFAGRIDLAQPWYDAAHRLASADGDRPTIGALLHNSATFRLTSLRQSRYRHGVSEKAGAFALLSAQSNAQFDQFLGSTTLPFLTPMLLAQVLTLTESFAEARRLFSEELESSVAAGAKKWHALYLAEKSWCDLRMNDREGARLAANLAAELVRAEVQPDERAYVHSRLQLVFAEIGDVAVADEQRRLAETTWTAHEAVQRAFVEALEGIPLDATSWLQ